MARDVEFFQQFLRRRYLVRLFIDLDMRQHQRRIDGKGAEHLSRLDVVEGIEAALEHLAVKRQNPLACGRFDAVEVCGMRAKDRLHIRQIEPLQNITGRRVGGRSFPTHLEGFVQPLQVGFDEGANAPERVGSRHNRQNGNQQNIGRLIQLSLSAARAANHVKERSRTTSRQPPADAEAVI